MQKFCYRKWGLFHKECGMKYSGILVAAVMAVLFVLFAGNLAYAAGESSDGGVSGMETDCREPVVSEAGAGR